MSRHLYATALLAVALSSLGAMPNEHMPRIFTDSAIVLRVPGDFSTIQEALDAALAGDTVLVGPGTYVESIDFDRKDVALRSVAGPENTIIEGSGEFETPVVNIGPYGELVGFTVRGGRASFGAGASVRGDGTLIAHNIFDSNAQGAGGFGAAIAGNASSPLVDGNWFVNNTCDHQGLSGVVTFVNRSSPHIVNNVFINNPCRALNMTLPRDTRPFVMNNTIVANEVGILVDTRVPANTQWYRNNIIVGNGIGFHDRYGSESNAPLWENNLVFDNTVDFDGMSDPTGHSGNISADPMFEDALGGNFHLLKGSPAIDAGGAIGAPPHDFDGRQRPEDGDSDGVAAFDIGAYEFRVNVIHAHFDVQPGSCPNPLALNKQGVIPSALLGSDDFDVHDVDLSTVRLQGTEPDMSMVADLGHPGDGEPCDCSGGGPDGYEDLVMKFDAQLILDSLFPVRAGERRELTLTGNLLDGTPFEAVDCVVLRGSKGPAHSSEMSGSTPSQVAFAVGGNGYVQRARFELSATDHVTLEVFDVTGRQVKTLVRGVESAGVHSIEWEVGGIASGVYFYRLTVGSTRITRKSTIIR
jgi:hypothetical protein